MHNLESIIAYLKSKIIGDNLEEVFQLLLLIVNDQSEMYNDIETLYRNFLKLPSTNETDNRISQIRYQLLDFIHVLKPEDINFEKAEVYLKSNIKEIKVNDSPVKGSGSLPIDIDESAPPIITPKMRSAPTTSSAPPSWLKTIVDKVSNLFKSKSAFEISPEEPLSRSINKRVPIPAPVSQDVHFNIYAPAETSAGEDILIQLWMYLMEYENAVKEKAMQFDEDAEQRAQQQLFGQIEVGEKLIFIFEPKNMPDQKQTVTDVWRGKFQSINFDLSIPENFSKINLICSVLIYRESKEWQSSTPVGKCIFKIGIEKKDNIKTNTQNSHKVKKFKNAFISYSSSDRAEVLKRVQMLPHFNVDFFQDVISLTPGERWEKELYKNIDNCDVFFLFWSQAAKDSKWVAKEIEYAINLAKNNEDEIPVIHPIPLEGPPVISPPSELGHLHFNDGILYFIAAS